MPPHFNDSPTKISPTAAPLRPLYRPSSPEGSEDSLSRASLNSVRSTRAKQTKAVRTTEFTDGTKVFDSTRRSTPYGAEDKEKKRVVREGRSKEKQEERWRDRHMERQKNSKEKEKVKETRNRLESYGTKSRKICDIDPDGSALAALQLCQSSEGSKILGMSENELKSLSSTLAKVTRGDSCAIYQVLVDFIWKERRLSLATSEFNEESQNFTDVFDSGKEKTCRNSAPGGEKDDPNGLTFYHSDTSIDVSPRKFDTLVSSVPSPPLDTSSPKSIGSSVAVQTESHDHVTKLSLAVSSHTSGVSAVGESSAGQGPPISVSTGQYSSGTNSVQESEGFASVGLQTATPPNGSHDTVVVALDSLTTHVCQTVPGKSDSGSMIISQDQRNLPQMTSQPRYIAPEPGGKNSVDSTGSTAQQYLTHRLPRFATVALPASNPMIPSPKLATVPSNATVTTGTTHPTSTSRTTYHSAVTGTSYTNHITGTMHPVSVIASSYPSAVTELDSRTSVSVPSQFTTSCPLYNQSALTQLGAKFSPVAGNHALLPDRSSFPNTSLERHARAAFNPQGFFTAQLPEPSQKRAASVNNIIGMCGSEQIAPLNNEDWGRTTMTQSAHHRHHREEEDWNWRTQVTSQIQMVIPPVLDIPGVLCVGLTTEVHLPIHNPTSRWIRCSSVIVSCSLNGRKVDQQYDCPFSFHGTILVGPKLTEQMKIQFSCLVAGIYVAQIKVVSTPVGSSVDETSAALVTVQGFSEQPEIKILADEGQTLDFGELHHGCNAIRPVRILNKGRTPVPLKMLICSSSSPGIFVFSKNNLPDEIVKSEIQSTALKCVLSANNDVGVKPEPLTIWIELVGKTHHSFEKSDPAETFTGGINIQLDTCKVAKILGNIPLRGVIGFTKIQIPKAFQMAMCLSAPLGQKVTRQMPFSNAGNICSYVELTIPKHSDVFTAIPSKFQVRPGSAVIVQVGFSPRVNDSYESVIQVSELDGTKCYEVLLRGSSVEPPPEMEEGPPILSNKSWLCWTGVDIGKATHQRLFLLNDSANQPIHFQAVILGEHSDFEIQRMKSDYSRGGASSQQMSLRPKERMPVYVLFAPSSFGVFKSSLVLKPDRGPRFQIPLYAYGGTSDLSICNMNKTSDGYVADLGQLSLGNRKILKITLKNSGSRAAFVKAVCYADYQIRLHYPQTHLSIVPSEFILPERSSKELVIVFQPLQHDASACQSHLKRVATVVLYHGDEVLRQWYKRNLASCLAHSGRRSSGKFDNITFDKSFQDENCVSEDFDFPDLENWEQIFDHHVSEMLLNLLGGAEDMVIPSKAADEESIVMATPRKSTSESSSLIKKSATAQLENGTKNNPESNTVGWSLIPEQLSLKVPVQEPAILFITAWDLLQVSKDGAVISFCPAEIQNVFCPFGSLYLGSSDSTKKVQLLNFSDRPLEFEFIWPAHCIAVTPHIGTIPPKNQTLIHVSVWASISSSGIELPWRGAAYVNCDDTKKALAIQIHKHLVSDGSPAPLVINKRLPKLDPDKDDQLLGQTYSKLQKQNQQVIITPKMVDFPDTEVGKVSSSVVTLENVTSSSVRWKFSSIAPAYAKVNETSTEILRATYPVFRFSSHSGLIRPAQSLKTNPESPLTSTKQQMELSGKAVTLRTSASTASAMGRKVRTSDPVGEKVQELSFKETEPAKMNKNISVESDNVHFPDTEVGKTSVAKIKICNRSATEHQFNVVSPKPPFSIRCSDIFTKPSHYLKINVYFSPEQSKDYEGQVFLTSKSSGESLSVKLHGKSTPVS